MACLFQIRDGAIPAKLVHQDEQVFAIEDIRPQGPVHLLIIPGATWRLPRTSRSGMRSSLATW